MNEKLARYALSRAAWRAVAASLFGSCLALPARAQECESARPTSPAGSAGLSYGNASVGFLDSPSGRARVHYALTGAHAPPAASDRDDGVPDAVAAAAQAADDALERYAELGFELPIGDGGSPCADHGGSDAVDIYLLHFAAADGQALIDHCQAGAPRRCAGFVLVENDFRGGGYADASEGMRTVVPHELFHLVQNAYDADLERWWAEGSAQWAAKQVYPELTDLERFLPAYFDNPWRPLNVPPSGVVASFLYATAIWPVFLHERFDAALVREVYEALALGEASTLPATDRVLQARGASLAEEFLWFAAYNAATGERTPAEGGYAHAADYPLVELTPFEAEAGTTPSEIGSGLGTFYYSVSSAEPLELSLEADPARWRGLLLPLRDGRPKLEAAAPLPAELRGDAIVVVAGQSLSRVDAAFELRAAAPDDEEPTPPKGAEKEPQSSGCAVAALGGSVWQVGVWLGFVITWWGGLRARRTRKENSRCARSWLR